MDKVVGAAKTPPGKPDSTFMTVMTLARALTIVMLGFYPICTRFVDKGEFVLAMGRLSHVRKYCAIAGLYRVSSMFCVGISFPQKG